MARYIDATKLEELCDIMADKCDGGPGESIWNQFRTTVEWSPTADVVEVVRCKDCKHHEDEQAGMVYCQNIDGGWVENYFFCKDGERREDGEIH